MIRQTVRSAALFAAGLLLAGGAWGQAPELTLRQVSSAPQLVAAEYFGGDPRMVQVSKMDIVADVDGEAATQGLQRSYVGLNLMDEDTAGGNTVVGVTDGNVAEITFELHGATFDQPASPTNLDQRSANCAGAPLDVIEASVVNGGQRGDSTVTYRVEVTDTGDVDFSTDTAVTGAPHAICFWIPDLSVTLAPVSAPGVTPVVRGVNVTATEIKAITSTGTPFPTRISGAMDRDVNMNDTVDPSEVGNAHNLDVRILQAAPALTAGLGTGDDVEVRLEDRTKIAIGGTPDPSASNPATATRGLRVGTFSITPSGNSIWKLDGSGYLDAEAIDSSLSGQIEMTVGGRYQSGDRLVVGSGPTASMGEIDGGIAKVVFQIEAGSKHIVYVPGGVDALKPGTFAAGAMYNFNDRRNHNSMILPMSTGTIDYFGVNEIAYAYGVVRGSGVDASFVRVTCNASAAAECVVFLDCTDQAGDEYFDAAPSIPKGETHVWSSNAIAEVLNGGWTMGRGRCDIRSTGDLHVQHMVRSGGGVLVNNSTVVGRELDSQRDAEIKAIDAVVDNICASVDGHGARAANDANGDGDVIDAGDSASIMATVCSNAFGRARDLSSVDTTPGTGDGNEGL